MRVRKAARYFLIFLVSILGLVVLLFISINLPFTHGLVTKKTNQILSQSNLPIQIEKINRILPNSIKMEGIVIADPDGDTIIHVGRLQTNCRLLALMQKKVILKELDLSEASVDLLMNYNTRKYNIAEVFTSGKKPKEANDGESRKSWEISIKKGELTSTHFWMTDSISGIHILEDVSGMKLKRFVLSLSNREIVANTLELDNATGYVKLGSGQSGKKSKKGAPWNFGLLNMALNKINFTFGKGSEGLLLEMILGEAKIKANQMDMRSRVVDLKSFSLARATATIQTGSGSETVKALQEDANAAFRWSLKSKKIDLEDVGLDVEQNDTTGLSLEGVNVHLRGFQFDKDHADVEINRVAFEAGNGFAVKDIQGELDSDTESTKLNLLVETGNSRLNLEGFAAGGLLEVISDPGELGKAHLTLNETTLSLRDMAYFVSGMDDHPGFTNLEEQPYTLEGNIEIDKSVFDFTGVTLHQDHNIHVTIDGKAEDLFQFSKARGNLDVGISGVNRAWLNKVLAGFGMKEELPQFSTFSLKSNISESFKAPAFTLKLKSSLGNLDGSGSVNFETDSFSVHSLFNGVLLGEILKHDELGSLTGSAEITGRGFSLSTMHSGFSLLLDSLRFHEYTYNQASIEGKLQPDEYDFRLQVIDSSLQADLTTILNPADSLFAVHASGKIFAQLNELQFLKDTLSVETDITANLTKRGSLLDTDLSLSGITILNDHDSAEIQQMDFSLVTDTVNTTLKAEADFFQLDFMAAKPIRELSTLGESMGVYLATFSDPQHKNASTRVEELPLFKATGKLTFHPVLDMFTGDSILHFTNIDLSIENSGADDKLHSQIDGAGLEYGVIKIGSMTGFITDSAGTVNIVVSADDNSINTSSANNLLLNSSYIRGQSLTEFTIHNKEDQVVYGFELASEADSGHLILTIPSKELIMNQKHWQMDTTSLLSVNLANGKVSPGLKMHTDSSFIQLLTRSGEGEHSFKGVFSNVALSSLLQEGLITGKPAGSISGSVDYSLKGKIEKQVKSDLQFSDVSWSGLEFNTIDLNGAFNVDTSNAYSIDMSLLLDSSKISAKGEKVFGGTGTLQTEFSSVPIHTFEPFVKKHLSDLGGYLSGDFNISAREDQENFIGKIYITDGNVRINTLNSQYKIPHDSVKFSGQRVLFDKFRIVDSLHNKLLVDGSLDFSNHLAVSADMEISSSKLQVMNRSAKEDVPLYGTVFVDSRLSVKGPLTNPDIKGDITLSHGTDIFYRYMENLSLSETEKIVSFVSQSSLDKPETKHLIQPSSTIMNSSIETLVKIDPTTTINFNLNKRIFDIDIMIKGGGSLKYNMLNKNKVALMGKYEIRDGSADVKLIGWPNKSFTIAENGFIRWEGPVDNPELNFEAVNKVSSSYTNPVDGKQRDVDFNVILKLTHQLSDLDILFTINTTDQYLMSIINTLSPEEQMRQAITILLFDYVDLPGITTSSNYMSQQVNQLLASQLNSLAKTTIQGVDISFGIDSYVQSTDGGGEETKTSLSYEVRKSFLNNRAQIEFSGRLNDLTQQQGNTDFSLNNLSFEYRLDSASTQFIKVYNEHSYEDVFTGEVVKTGIGYTYRKRYKHISDIWRRKERNKPKKSEGK